MKYSRGRPMPTTKYQDRMIVCKSRADPRLNSVDIHREMSTYHGFKASIKTLWRRFCARVLNRRRFVEKPIIYLINKKARVEFAKRHIRWIANEWQKLIISDESKFLLFGSDGIKHLLRSEGQKSILGTSFQRSSMTVEVSWFEADFGLDKLIRFSI